MTAVCGSPNARRTGGATHLPALGRRGEGWVALQACLILAVAVAAVLGRDWAAPARPWLAVGAAALAAGGLTLFVGGLTGLGRQLTPFPKPVAEGELCRQGVYGWVRHPMYGGVLLLVLALALVSSPLALLPWALAGLFLETKRRREEAWLIEQHLDYDDYRRRVPRRFVPYVW
jgi:protein-S-isoprenylcysteine O-methyltransferase Ste14